jgi:hypothetical protein
MESIRSHVSHPRHSFNEERHLRRQSSLDVTEGYGCDLVIRPVNSVGALKTGIHESLKTMRQMTVLSAILSCLYITQAFIVGELTYPDASEDSTFTQTSKSIGIVLAAIQVFMNIVYYKAVINIRRMQGLIYEKSKH